MQRLGAEAVVDAGCDADGAVLAVLAMRMRDGRRAQCEREQDRQHTGDRAPAQCQRVEELQRHALFVGRATVMREIAVASPAWFSL